MTSLLPDRPVAGTAHTERPSSQELVLLSTWNATLMWIAGLAHEDGRAKGKVTLTGGQHG